MTLTNKLYRLLSNISEMHCENTASTAGTDDSGADGKEKTQSCSSVSADEKSADGSFASKKIKLKI